MKICPNCHLTLPQDDLAYCPHCEANLTKDIYERSMTTGTVWAGVGVIAAIALVIFLLTMYQKGLYDQGYADGSEEVKNELLYIVSGKYQEGYDDGEKIAWYFDQGCKDKASGTWPKYPEEEKYMEGYHFC
ncbi:MAG: hypothetical protein KC897_02045 [Candidatus Omnitrophica bacterium]|nr:hypothetical protein [Candidatus Omnitrophota bacterium]MCB9720338.1 hypothetical protein [Candidatus Omnitrophota bacterium]